MTFLGWTGLFTVNDVHNMTDEILKMKHFDHPNVMTLIGVCVSIGGGPAIIMPYMENGSLLSYLRKDKTNIIMNDDQDIETVSILCTMCIVLLSDMNMQVFFYVCMSSTSFILADSHSKLICWNSISIS